MKKLLLLSLSLLCLEGFSQDAFYFTKENCSIIQGRYDSIGGREAFTGTAVLKDIEFTNGTIEWDLWAKGGRSYAGVLFHHQDNRDCEEFYVRPHKGNGLFGDAFQYTPVYHGVSCWQLSHGEGGTQAAIIPAEEWIHFKLSVKDKRAILTMYTEEYVTMNIDQLWLGSIMGSIGVKGPANGSTYFSNFKWSDELDIEFPPEKIVNKPEPGILSNWEISTVLSHNETDPYKHYKDLKELDWEKALINDDGLVNITQQVIRNPQLPGWIYAKTTINSDYERLAKFQLGYSDYITVFVNGNPIMASTNAYLSRDPSFAGLIGYFDEIFLPLKKGENEICLLVGEQFGGWGFMMRDGEAERLKEGISKVWEIKHNNNFPESIVYDPKSDILFVSNYIAPSGGAISKISLDGKIIEKEWIKGLMQPTGIITYADKLFVVERRDVAVIDIGSAEIDLRINLEDAVFLNDIAVSEDGTLYVGDSGGSKIYIIKDNIASIWMDGGELKNPNGLEYYKGKLFVGCTGDATIKEIDILTKEVKILSRLPDGSVVDGIQALNNGSVLSSDFNGHLFIVDKGGNRKEIINTISRQINLADFEYINEKNLIIVPGLYSNVIGAYSLKGFE